MKFRISKYPERGSTLMVTLFMVFLLGFFLFAYLYLVRTQRGFVSRSQAWNGAMAMAEAGVEEALAQLNPGAPAPTVDRTSNGWGQPANGIYGPVTRSLTNNNGSYSVIYTTDTFPIIYSTGYVSVASIPATLTRVVRVTTAYANIFRAGLATKYNLDLKGNNINTDSFNSANPSQSTFGQYDPLKTSTNGDIASVQGIVNVGNATVNGTVLLGPTASETMNNGLITGGVTNDFNYEFPDVVLPTGSPIPAAMSLIPFVDTNGVSYDYSFFVGGYYSINNLKNSDSIYVAPNTTVTLLLTGNASVNNIYVSWGGTNGTSGNLTVYMDGPTFSVGGNQTVDSGNALNFTYYGTTNNTKVTFGGNSAFTGTIYAPEAAFGMGGGGSTPYDFVGAAVVGSATMNGHFKFHYDENLTRNGPKSGYVATSWSEL
jgi:hypothetical protein